MSKYLFEEQDHKRVEMYFDDFDDSFRFVETQNVDQILNETKRKFNDYGDYLSTGKRGEWHHTHSIPEVLWAQWQRETAVQDEDGRWIYMIDQDPKVQASYLNNPDYAYFKVSNTKL